MMRPDLILELSRKFVAIETKSERTRGYSLFDDRPHRNDANATVINRIDAEGFFLAWADLLRAGAR